MNRKTPRLFGSRSNFRKGPRRLGSRSTMAAAAEEVRLWSNNHEREHLESLADLFAIIKATEKLERAYVRDLVPGAAYEAECLKLIGQFKTVYGALSQSVRDVRRFAEAYGLDCPTAFHRLLTAGVPATLENRAAAAAAVASSSASSVASCVQCFITAMDAVKLNMLAVDQVHPLLSELAATIAKLSGPTGILPPDFEGKVKVREWLSRMSHMGAADELTEQQARQLHFDLESSYNSFMAALPNAGM